MPLMVKPRAGICDYCHSAAVTESGSKVGLGRLFIDTAQQKLRLAGCSPVKTTFPITALIRR